MKLTVEQRPGLGGTGYKWSYEASPGQGSLQSAVFKGRMRADGLEAAIAKILDELKHYGQRFH